MSERQLTSLHDALTPFVGASDTQGQRHIIALHRHLAERMVIDHGFRPEHLMPRPPLRSEPASGAGPVCRLIVDPTAAHGQEQIIYGGLKTKQVDIVVDVPTVGPCVAISVKGTVKAFRNLTNRMEEAAGDCVNLHLAYPALVYGFAHFLRGNREEEAEKPDDVAIRASGDIAPAILRYHDVMSRLTGRLQITEQPTSYEAVSLAIAQTGDRMGSLLPGFPHSDSALRYEVFWEHVCAAYDMRFVYSAPMLAGRTSRLAWTPDSPALEEARACGFIPRLAPGC